MKSKLMTKLVLVAAVACAAVGARATALYFTIDGVQSSDGSALTSGSYLAYLFVASANTTLNYPTVTKADILNALSTKTTSALDSLAMPRNSNQNWYVANTGVSSDGAAVWNGTDAKVVTDSSKYSANPTSAGDVSMFALLLDASSVESASNYMFASKDGSETVSNVMEQKNQYNFAVFNFGSQSGNSWISIASIPEPTGGVLLLVGVAALALRRKKAA